MLVQKGGGRNHRNAQEEPPTLGRTPTPYQQEKATPKRFNFGILALSPV